jgi:hypothetical protein
LRWVLALPVRRRELRNDCYQYVETGTQYTVCALAEPYA